jgi:hypothetical protein
MIAIFIRVADSARISLDVTLALMHVGIQALVLARRRLQETVPPGVIGVIACKHALGMVAVARS